MAYRKIEEIIVNGVSGEIFNAYIYGSNLELGFSESPTKLSLSIVKENGDFSSFPNSLLTSYEIKIGTLTLSRMYLYSYEISRSVGQKTATLNFLDGSFILDKIFVGLINRHGVGPAGIPIDFSIPAKCTSCDGAQTIDVVGTLTRSIASGLIVNVDPKTGGSIILGQEQFVEGQCDIPDVAYNFTQLLESMSQAGITVSGLVDVNPNYFQAYIGTLREVLSNWCADFGYSFYWDLITNSIKGIDLKIEVDYINEIKNLISKNSSLNTYETEANTLAIESFNESESLEGTTTQKHISRYLKPFRTKSTSRSITNTRLFSCIKPESFKIDENDIKRAVLGKYSDSARTAFCVQDQTTKQLEYLGFEYIWTNSIFTISSSKKTNNIFTDIVDLGYNNPAITEMIDKYNGADVLIAVYDPQKEEIYKTWEAGIADMLGKYYRGDIEPANQDRTCTASLFSQKQVAITPNAQIYTNKNKRDLPFANVLNGPQGASDVEWGIPTLYLFSRDTTYGTTQEQYNQTILNNGDDPFSQYKPQILPIEGIAYTYLINAKSKAERTNQTKLARTLTSIINEIDKLKTENTQNSQKQVVFCFLPPQAVMNQAIQVSIINTTNKSEVARGENDEEQQEECVVGCDADSLQQVCGKCSEQTVPFVGLTDRTARAVALSCIGGKKIELIFPSEATYQGYETVTTNTKFTVPGQKIVLGNINNIDDNTLTLQVVESDISNDLDPLDGSTIINMLVPDGATKNFKNVTPAQYHADLSKKIINSITIPRKNLSLSIIGLNFGDLSYYISPDKGLVSFSINLSENGITSQLSFANRPKVLPKREAISQKIQPTIKLNTYRPK